VKAWLLVGAFALGGVAAGAVVVAVPAFDRAAARNAVSVGELEAAVPLSRGAPAPLERAKLKSRLERLKARVAEREAYLRLPEGTTDPARFADLGIELDVEGTSARALAVRPAPGYAAALRRAFGFGAEAPKVSLVFRVRADAARAWLEKQAPGLHRDPENARLDLVGHARIEAREGRDLDVGRTLAAIAEGERDDLAVFDAAFVTLEPAVTSDDLVNVDVSRVLSSFETDFSKKPRSRVPNIRTAARYLNGVVVGPGEVLSFNRVVGPRTEARGFREAPVIVADELEKGLGGGVCQVASTLFGAAMLGGFEIVKRRSHSRPSGYAPLGLDAAVIYEENIDLQLRNPYATPVIVHAFLPNQKMLRVELLGREPPGKVEHFFAVHERAPFTRRVTVKSDLPSGTIDKRQKGSQGYDGTSTLVIEQPDGKRLARTYPSKYYPVPEVFWIASDVPVSALPPLPEGATAEAPRAEGDEANGERDDAQREP
jgi:vancomycin resistance protein YoaR